MEPKKKKTPERRCICCGEHMPKPELLRVVRSPSGEVTLDMTGKKSGRGAYVCRSEKCIERALSRGLLSKHLDCPIPDEVKEALAAEVERGS